MTGIHQRLVFVSHSGADTWVAKQIAREIEDRLEYPGQVKVIVIRESRAIEIAK